ncbi:Heterokaryon incompatibility protein 6, OR allele [Pseudocercospora fuligena]|uniref:Heterokaryon incompatibility protein 6, OR allele n=1 Tax=Pseudocercospora fuligena TaxID=685502 RepID=A0A8H6RWW4_9PEZI|nr:Heterokaryon incompatibility protein 6, OR allele [Pseudocercospora fuligena]
MALKAHQKSRLHPRLNTLLGRQYTYRPLDSRRQEIRLLTIEPGSGLDDKLRGTFRHIALLDDRPTYNSLSYVWGDAAERSSISVDGKLLDIPQSSEKALRRVRKRDEFIVVWIDAVCINQDDEAERSQQVAMMADIYRNGHTNFVILGHDAPESTESALNSMDLLREIEIEDAIEDGTSLVDVIHNMYGTNRDSTAGFTFEMDQSALAEFYAQPWFHRLWVVQEFALAKCNICLFGQYEIQLEHILMSARWLDHKYNFLDGELSYHAGRINASVMFDYTNSPHSVYGSRLFKPDILTIMNTISRHLSCEDLRDKVYATLGLIDWSEHCGLPPELAPDYSRGVADVLTLAASWAIRSNQWEVTDKLLSTNSHRSSEDIHLDGLPSWVPRWHRRYDNDQDSPLFRTREIRGLAEGQSSVELRSADVAASSRWIVNGIRIDVLQEVALTRDILSWVNFAEDYVKPLQHFMELSGQNLDRDVAGVVLSADTWSDFNPLTEGNRQHLTQCLNEETEGVRPFAKGIDLWPDCEQAIVNACTGRAVALTKSGLLCLVPRITTAGNIVVWLSDSAYPTILRPCGDNYEVLGYAYVHGITDGEAIEAWKARGGKVETFSLI